MSEYHYDGCWRVHLECAILRAETMEKHRDEWMKMYMDALRKLQAIKALEASVGRILADVERVGDN